MAYNHGIRVLEQPTGLQAPVTSTAGLQVIFGTAPVNLVADPYHAVNKPILAHTYAEAVEQLGYSDDYDQYTLCQSMDACFKLFAVAPIIFINVLDPSTHKAAITAKSYSVTAGQVVINDVKGILADTVEVKKDDTVLTPETDYITGFDADGYLVISIAAGGAGAGAQSLTVSASRIDPGQVEAEDIIGGYNTSTGAETGLELVRQIYPMFGLVPGLLLAPGWSQDAAVAAALGAKCEEINGVFRCEALIDLGAGDGGALKYADCNAVKNSKGLSNPHTAVLWPSIKVGDKIYAHSAIFGALAAYTDSENDDVPNISPSNRTIPMSATVLDDGTEILLDQIQANVLNGQGIITAINVNGWRSWGNNTAAYPVVTDPKDRWFCCRRFFSWWGNSFILTYFQNVDDPANFRLIESIVDSENIRGNSYVSQGKCAAARIEYREDENTVTDILDGKIRFHQYLAPYTPAEDIVNVLEFDPNALAAALNG